MQGVRGCSGMRFLVWLRVSQGGWVRSESGKDYPIILVIANFIFVPVEPGISNNLFVFQYFAWAMGQVKAAFLQAAERDKVQWKVWNVGYII